MDTENEKLSLFIRKKDKRGKRQRLIIQKGNLGSIITKRIPRITLYSSASRRSSITSAMGNGFGCDLPDFLLSDTRTILFDFLFLQIINFTCNDRVIIIDNNVIVIKSRYHTLSRLHTDRNRRRYLLLFLVFNFVFLFSPVFLLFLNTH